MLTFIASGYVGPPCHCCGEPPVFEMTVVVVANTASEARGLLLEKYPATQSQHWGMVLIDPTKVGITE